MLPETRDAIARLTVAVEWWKAEPVAPGVTLITEPHVDILERANLWLVEGTERDMLIDSGMGVAPLRPFVDGLRREGKPLVHVLSHAHIDHMGGSWEFDARLIHPAEAEDLAAGDPAQTLMREEIPERLLRIFEESGYPPLPPLLIDALPHAGYDVPAYELKGAPATGLLEEGNRVDLGDRAFTVLHLPGHSDGGIGLLDEKDGAFFTGDAVYDGPLIVFDARVYAGTLRRLRDIPFRLAHAGHDPSFGPDGMRRIVDAYLPKLEALAAG